ncbi:Protein T27A10.2, partial [Aphelenchoides avenae]
MDVARNAGLLALNPSDLVFEASKLGIAYYDFVLSVSQLSNKDYELCMAKLDPHTHVESFETVRVPAEILTKNSIPPTELALITMGVLVWRQTLAKSRLLCLVNHLNDDNSSALEALKRATYKFKCLHHVLCVGARRPSSTGSVSSTCSNRSTSSQDGMKLRIMMCQTRSELDLSSQAVREA